MGDKLPGNQSCQDNTGNVLLEVELLEQGLPSSPPETPHGHGLGRGPPWFAAGCSPIPGDGHTVPLGAALLSRTLPELCAGPRCAQGHRLFSSAWGEGEGVLEVGAPPELSFLGNRLEEAATESCLRKCLGPLIFLRVNLKRNPGKFCTCVSYTCRCFSSTGEQPLAPGPGSTGQGDSHGSPGCRLRYRKQQSNVQVLGCARHCFVVSFSCCRVCSAPAPAAVPIRRAKHSRAPSQPRGAE